MKLYKGEGWSMQYTINPNDYILIDETKSDIRTGDSAIFYSKIGKRIVCHRIVRIGFHKYIEWGENNVHIHLISDQDIRGIAKVIIDSESRLKYIMCRMPLGRMLQMFLIKKFALLFRTRKPKFYTKINERYKKIQLKYKKLCEVGNNESTHKF